MRENISCMRRNPILYCMVLCAVVLSLIPLPVRGEMKTVTHTVKQSFGGSQSPDDARIAAVARAKREALEMAGTYVESFTVVRNSRLEKDEILALTAGVLKAEVVSQKNYHTDDAFGVEVVVRIDVDTSVLEDRVKKLLADRTHLEQLNQARKKEKELLDTVAKLQEENKRLTAEKKSTEQLKGQFHEASQGLTAVDWNGKAMALWQDGKFTDPQKAIEYLNEAIRLKPNYAEAYINRGAVYGELGQYQRAIEDHNEAIRLKPNYAIAYNNRGAAYHGLVQYQRAIEDFNEAIRLKPDYALAYIHRGAAYGKLNQHKRAFEECDTVIRLKPDLAMAYVGRGSAYANFGQYQNAIEDYDNAIRLNPNLDQAYNNRGFAYWKLGQYQRAIEDYSKAILLNPNFAIAYNNRGFAYNGLGQQQRAIEDYNTAIRLKPDYALAYNNRGVAYLLISNKVRGCSDAQKACSMGNCKAYELAKKQGKCR